MPDGSLSVTRRIRIGIWVVLFLVAIGWWWMAAIGVPPGRLFPFAYDFLDFYHAARRFMNGIDPYSSWRFTKPPLLLWMMLPLALVPVSWATGLFTLATVWAAVGGVWILQRTHRPSMRCEPWFWMVTLLAGYPVAFLVMRLNLEGLLVLLVALHVAWLSRRPAWSGVLLALAAGIKLYPVLLVLPLLAAGRRRALQAFLSAMTVVVLLAPWMWMRFLRGTLLFRIPQFRLDENCSLATPFVLLWQGITGARPQGTPLVVLAGVLVLYLALVCWSVYLDRRLAADGADAYPLSVAAMIPLMVAMPFMVFPYEMVLPPLSLLLMFPERDGSRFNGPLLMAGFGVALTQVPAFPMVSLWGWSGWQGAPGAGLLCLVVAVNWAKHRRLRFSVPGAQSSGTMRS